jgi:hypothetical protein
MFSRPKRITAYYCIAPPIRIYFRKKDVSATSADIAKLFKIKEKSK